MNKRIKIYALILSIVYTGLIVHGLADFIDGFSEDCEEVDKEKEKNQDYEMTTFYINVESKTGFHSFPTKTSEAEQAPLSMLKMNKITVKQQISILGNHSIYFGVIAVVIFILLACILYVPFLFFKIVAAVTKGEIFGVSVVKRITKIGWIMIVCFTCVFYIEAFDFYYARQFVQIDGYEIVFSIPNFSTLILGLITLFLGEVLRASILMKEEQDLTI